MEFRELASNQTSALIARLLAARADESRRHVDALRAALEAASRTLDTLAEPPAEPLDDDVRKLVEALAAAAEADTRAATERTHAEGRAKIEKAQAEARAAVERAQLELETAIEAARAENEAAHEAHARARAISEDELQEVRGLLETALAQAGDINHQLDAVTKEKMALAAEVATAQNKIDAANTQKQSLNSLLKASNARVQTLEKAHAEMEASIAELKKRLESVTRESEATTSDLKKRLEAARESEATIEDLKKRLDAATRDAQAAGDALKQRTTSAGQSESALQQRMAEAERAIASAHAEVETMRERALVSTSLLSALPEAFQRLAKATTIAEVLTTLVTELTAEFSRAALFRVKGNRLEGEHQVGFDFQSDITNVIIPLSIDSLLVRAVMSGAIESLSAADLADTSRAPFGGSPTCAVALPLVVMGDTLAIVYADDSGTADLADRAPTQLDAALAFGDLLRQHAVALLMRLSTELKTLAELREYATTLLNEVEHMFTADVDAKKKDADLRSRLTDNLECARRIYAQRVALEGPAAVGLLDDALATLVEVQNGTPFGRALAAVAGKAGSSKERNREATA